jgi:hypothetical protein
MSKLEYSEHEVQILKPPTILMVDLVSEDEIEPPHTLPQGVVEPILISDEPEPDIKMLGERGRVVKVWGKW